MCQTCRCPYNHENKRLLKGEYFVKIHVTYIKTHIVYFCSDNEYCCLPGRLSEESAIQSIAELLSLSPLWGWHMGGGEKVQRWTNERSKIWPCLLGRTAAHENPGRNENRIKTTSHEGTHKCVHLISGHRNPRNISMEFESSKLRSYKMKYYTELMELLRGSTVMVKIRSSS